MLGFTLKLKGKLPRVLAGLSNCTVKKNACQFIGKSFTESILADDGITQTARVFIPYTAAPGRFVRLAITGP